MTQMDEVKRLISTELAQIHGRETDLETALRVLEEMAGEVEPPSPGYSTSHASYDIEDTGTRKGGLFDLDIDMTGARTQKAKVMRIALANGGVLHPTEAARYMVEMGYSNGKPDSLRLPHHYVVPRRRGLRPRRAGHLPIEAGKGGFTDRRG